MGGVLLPCVFMKRKFNSVVFKVFALMVLSILLTTVFVACNPDGSVENNYPEGAIALTKEKIDCYNLLNIKATRIKNALINSLTTSFKKYDSLKKSYGLNHFDELLETKNNEYKLLHSKLIENLELK